MKKEYFDSYQQKFIKISPKQTSKFFKNEHHLRIMKYNATYRNIFIPNYNEENLDSKIIPSVRSLSESSSSVTTSNLNYNIYKSIVDYNDEEDNKSFSSNSLKFSSITTSFFESSRMEDFSSDITIRKMEDPKMNKASLIKMKKKN